MIRRVRDVRLPSRELQPPGRFVRLALAVVAIVPALGLAQSSIRVWGEVCFDTAAWEQPAIGVWAAEQQTVILRADGRLFVQGGAWPAPPPPAGTVFVGTATSGSQQWGIALCADGSAVTWGGAYAPPVPPLPPGIRYTHVAAGFLVATFARSDGVVLGTGAFGGSNSFGELTPPQPPPGVTVSKLVAYQYHHLALLSNGTIMAWGDNREGQVNVSPLPPGVVYTDVATGFDHSLGLRSDGQVVAFGSNAYGQLNVPPLPPGTVNQLIAAGWGHSVALRSDGVFVHWGGGGLIWNPPAIPLGLLCTQIGAGSGHNVALLSNGSLLIWRAASQPIYLQTLRIPVPTGTADRFVDASFSGAYVVLRADGTAEAYGSGSQAVAPPLPPGLRYTKVRSGGGHAVFLRSDGQLLFTGDNSVGQHNAPPLPAGTTWIDVEAHWADTIALRSDGEAFTFGNNASLVPARLYTIPPLPPGMRYVQADIAYRALALLRSDGQIVLLGSGYANTGMFPPPPLPPGLVYTEVATGLSASVALRSDGSAVRWPAYPPTSTLRDVPALPFGVYYVEVDMYDTSWFALRRSDGWIERCGAPAQDWFTPELDPGSSYVEICGHTNRVIITRVGPTSTYTGFSPGCAGSLPSSRLVPRDTPRIGQTLRVRLFDLPQDVAFMVLGWSRVAPVSLAPFGMPGCFQHISADAAVLLLGQNGQAVWELPIPNSPQLVGLQFFNQAVVPDSVANPLGAVVSDAMQGVVGHW